MRVRAGPDGGFVIAFLRSVSSRVSGLSHRVSAVCPAARRAARRCTRCAIGELNTLDEIRPVQGRSDPEGVQAKIQEILPHSAS
jgi:hypothetical protein